jgi:hypothetical protein
MQEHWFVPKSHGFGAVPVGWKGWAVTLGYVAVMVAWSIALVSPRAWTGAAAPSLAHVGIWLIGGAVLTSLFLHVVRSRTKGDWRWRWGE